MFNKLITPILSTKEDGRCRNSSNRNAKADINPPVQICINNNKSMDPRLALDANCQ